MAGPDSSHVLAVVVSDGVLAESAGDVMLHDVLLSGPGTTLFDVPASRLRSVDSVPVATLRQARLDADAESRRQTEEGPAGPSLAPRPARLAHVATAAAEAMRSISTRVPCAVCCCSVQEAVTAPVIVSERPNPRWLAKLKVSGSVRALRPCLAGEFLMLIHTAFCLAGRSPRP